MKEELEVLARTVLARLSGLAAQTQIESDPRWATTVVERIGKYLNHMGHALIECGEVALSVGVNLHFSRSTARLPHFSVRVDFGDSKLRENYRPFVDRANQLLREEQWQPPLLV